MPTGSPSTPTPFRTNAPTGQTHSRSQYEQEMWDDLANVVYMSRETSAPSTTGGTSDFYCSMDIPCPVKCRLQITMVVLPVSGLGGIRTWDAWIQVDGVDNWNVSAQDSGPGSAHSAAADTTVDVEPGTRTVRIRIIPNTTMSFNRKSLTVRRGRTPPS